MARKYGDVCLNAKLSSASMSDVKDYRSYVFNHDFDDVIKYMNHDLEFIIYSGFRIDRRGKYRLICSFPAPLRVVDFLVNNGTYQLCSEHGMYSRYTTEGANSLIMWDQLAIMSRRDGYSMVCIDYKGYDTQISLREYGMISYNYNKFRIDNKHFMGYFLPFLEWLRQPKCLVTRSARELEMLMPLYVTLASGLHGTHSFENLIGISTYREMVNIGLDIKAFWTNGDDQNTLIRNEHVKPMIEFLNTYYNISWDKSLIGHKLSVWGKLWSSEDICPIVEIGTFRSIWEKEGGSSELVEDSKFMSNYGKILQTLMILMRARVSKYVIEEWMLKLCGESEPKIDPYRIPESLSIVSNIKSGSSRVKVGDLKGLDFDKSYLKSKTFGLKLWNVSDYHTMLKTMYEHHIHFQLDVTDVKYHVKGVVFNIQSGMDYSLSGLDNIPYLFEKLVDRSRVTPEQRLIQDVLRSTKSYEGPVNADYVFKDMMTLAYCLVMRNKRAWDDKISSNQLRTV
jgi:hypothetical protein